MCSIALDCNLKAFFTMLSMLACALFPTPGERIASASVLGETMVSIFDFVI